jgi:hypothetical protein
MRHNPRQKSGLPLFSCQGKSCLKTAPPHPAGRGYRPGFCQPPSLPRHATGCIRSEASHQTPRSSPKARNVTGVFLKVADLRWDFQQAIRQYEWSQPSRAAAAKFFDRGRPLHQAIRLIRLGFAHARSNILRVPPPGCALGCARYRLASRDASS